MSKTVCIKMNITDIDTKLYSRSYNKNYQKPKRVKLFQRYHKISLVIV